jgi:hypothetical protein
MTLSRKVEDLKPVIGPEDFVWQMRERGLEVETHTHQLEEIRAVEVRVPKKSSRSCSCQSKRVATFHTSKLRF